MNVMSAMTSLKQVQSVIGRDHAEVQRGASDACRRPLEEQQLVLQSMRVHTGATEAEDQWLLYSREPAIKWPTYILQLFYVSFQIS